MAVLAMALVGASPAAAEPVGFTVEDRAGDARDPQVDIRSASLRFDRDTGLLDGTVSLGAAPTIQVADSVTFYLGRYATGSGECVDSHTAHTTIPDAEDVEVGLPLPYTELFRGRSDNAVGFLPSATSGGTINFSSAEANAEVVEQLRGQRLTCGVVETAYTGSFKLADTIATQPLLSGPRPRCRIAKRRVKGGRSFPIRCRGAGRRVTVRLYRYRSRTFLTGHERVRRGRLRVPTTASMRGTWRIALWKRDIVIAKFDRLRIR